MRRASVLGALLAIGLGGCALGPRGERTSTTSAAVTSPPTAATSTAPRATAPRATAPRANEVPTPAPRARVAAGWRSPVEALEEFATLYVNWDYRSVSLRLRALSAVSVGQARAMLSTAAAQVGDDDELGRGRVGNEGVVEAIAPVRGRDDQYAVVTRERTTAANSRAYAGLAPAWHVALATVTRVGGLWVLSAWQPES